MVYGEDEMRKKYHQDRCYKLGLDHHEGAGHNSMMSDPYVFLKTLDGLTVQDKIDKVITKWGNYIGFTLGRKLDKQDKKFLAEYELIVQKLVAEQEAK